MIALQEAARAGLMKPAHWANNIIAGLVVGVVALPLPLVFVLAEDVLVRRGVFPKRLQLTDLSTVVDVGATTATSLPSWRSQ